MSTLNLGRGLEVLYTFDDADTDRPETRSKPQWKN